MDYVLFDEDGHLVAAHSFDGVLAAATWAFEQGKTSGLSGWELQTSDGVPIAWPNQGDNDGDYRLSDEGLAIWREQ